MDDAPFIRKAVARVLSSDPDIRVVGEAASGVEALEMIPRYRPDVVTLDVDMPRLDGLATLRELKKSLPDLPVIMMSAHTQRGAATTLQALSDGAVDFIDKSSFNVMDFTSLSREVLGKIKVWDPGGSAKPPPRTGGPASQARKPVPAIPWDSFEVCVVGASTGGPTALEALLGAVPAHFPVPMVVVQHMPRGFTRPFADRLDSLSPLQVVEPRHGGRLDPGMAVIAPAGRHLRITGDLRVQLSREPATAIHRPSVDVTMYSAACALPPGSVVGVLLTGMGSDGAEGMFAVREKKGLTLAESEESCVVPGMPRAAYLRGAVTHYLPLPDIVRMFASHGPGGS